MNHKTYTITRIYSERECFHDHVDTWPCTVEDIYWLVEEDGTGRSLDSHDRKKDAVAQVARVGGVVSQVIT